MLLNRVLDAIEGRYVHCPRCLTRLPIRGPVTQDVPCEGCQFPIPMTYLQRCRYAPPVFVQLFGLSAAGKTTFLDMLRLHLYDMDQVWGQAGFYTEPITQIDADHKAILLNERQHGMLANSTAKRERDQNEVYIMSLIHMLRWNSRFLVLMDHAGEQFGSINVDAGEIPFLQQTPVTILLLSLPDLLQEGKRVDDLITNYMLSLENYGVNFAKEQRQLIIVFSKADLLDDLPSELQDYLSSDTLYGSLKHTEQRAAMSEQELDGYIHRMDEIDHIIRGWTRDHIAGGPALLNMLEDKHISAHFTVMSATGHPISNDPSLSANQTMLEPTPRRVLDPFFWVLEYYRHLGPQDVVTAKVKTIVGTFSPALRAGGSLALLGLLLLGTIGGGLYASRLSHGSPAFVGFCMALVLFLISVLTRQWITKPHPMTGNVLKITRLALVLICLVIQTLPEVQQELAQLKLDQLLGLFIAGSALFSCFQPGKNHPAQGRVTLAAIAGSGALLQYSYGTQAELPALPFSSPDAFNAINILLICVLATGAVLSLLLSTEKYIWLDHAILFCTAICFGGFQFALGASEIITLFPATSWEHAVQINNILWVLTAVALPFSLFIVYRFRGLNRLPLLLLGIVSALMLNFLGDSVIIPIGVVPFSLANAVGMLLLPSQIIENALFIAGGLMLIRWVFFSRFPDDFTFLDHTLLFFTAIICAQMQLFPWGEPTQLGQLATLNDALANSLMALVFVGGAVALLFLLFPLVYQLIPIEQLVQSIKKWGFEPEKLKEQVGKWKNLPLWIERLIVLGTIMSCALQAFFYGQDPVLAKNISPIVCGLIAALSAILALSSLFLVKRPFKRGSRLLLLLNIAFATAFYIIRANPLIPLAFVLQNWSASAAHSSTPNLLFALLLIVTALVSLWWSTRCKFSGDRRLLHIFFGLALFCGFLQLIVPALLFTLLALLMLTIGMVIATLATRLFGV